MIRDVPLDFCLSMTGIALRGKTNCRRDLNAFINKLERLADFLVDDTIPPRKILPSQRGGLRAQELRREKTGAE